MIEGSHAVSGKTSTTLEWCLLIPAIAFAFISGSVGFYQYDRHHAGEASWLTAAYHSLQLFALHAPHLEHPAPPWLQAGRWVAALVFFWALARIVLLALRKDWHALIVRWRDQHTVICGLGTLGLPLALQAQKYGWKPVAIEKDPQGDGVRAATSHGIPVVIGDAASPAILRRARVHRARRVFAVCARDDINVGVAVEAGRLARPRASSAKLECWLFIADSGLRAGLREQATFTQQGQHYHVNVRGLDVHAVRARRALADTPLDHSPVPAGSDKRVRLVIAGFGEMGQSLALQAGIIGHFANGEKLQVTIVDEQVERLMGAFEARYSMFRHICDVQVMAGSLDDPAIVDRLGNDCRGAEANDEPITIAICHDDNDALNLNLGLALLTRLPRGRSPVLVYLATTSGFAHLMSPPGPRALVPRLRPFGMLEQVWTLKTLIDEEQDQIARAMHDEYRDSLRRRREAGEAIARRPAEAPWEDLPDLFKDSNRALADHLPVKLNALGFHIDSLEGRGRHRITELNSREIEVVARMEHARWCAERWLAGWFYAEQRDDSAKKHPDLRPWKELPLPESRVDKDLMAAICRTLERVGKGVFR